MHRPAKPALLRSVLSEFSNVSLQQDLHYVIDGGYMLHEFRLQTGADMSDILPLFYICKFGPDEWFLMDDDAMSTIYPEHERHQGNTAEVNFEIKKITVVCKILTLLTSITKWPY